MILTPAELEAFTGKSARAQKRYGSQAAELDALGIPYLPRSDKTLIVYRAHVAPHGPTQKTPEQAPAVSL